MVKKIVVAALLLAPASIAVAAPAHADVATTESRTAETRVVSYGHSLGGALAELQAIYLK
ncbi:lipase family protein [Yinghuangia soli]|uniref:Fungal lipase-type domain-containing protein n=1 Tax=Yinghuangia soli TaxID=2908204 RepID=A0AA41PW99_9ACTN|nr:hypothetical protein [Yinghuangia soli]MCF2527050.1 hypothetical protein [Yinghuangia soli]